MRIEEIEKGMIVHENLTRKRMSVQGFQGDKIWCSYTDNTGTIKESLMAPEQLIKGEPPSNVSWGTKDSVF